MLVYARIASRSGTRPRRVRCCLLTGGARREQTSVGTRHTARSYIPHHLSLSLFTMPWLNATTSQERTLSPPESPENHIRVRSPYRLRKRLASFAAPMPRSVGSGCRIHNVRSAIDMHPRGFALVLSRRGLGAYLAVGSVRHDESTRVLLCKSLHAFILGRFRFGRVRV